MIPVGAAIDLYWLPLGAGGWFVSFNGRVYEWITAKRQRRRPLDLYHTALEVTAPEGRFIIENAWPIPDHNPEARGVTVQGPVWSPSLRRFRLFRYEIRRWRNGEIADIAYAVASPQRVSEDLAQVRALLALANEVPAHLWGRDELRAGDIWNSNSVISWLLTTAGVSAFDIHPPDGGRAPGWTVGALEAQRTSGPAITGRTALVGRR
jgi:hypothetical protein